MIEKTKKIADMWEPLDREVSEMEKISRKPSGFWRDVWDSLIRDRRAVAGLVFIVIMIALAALGPQMSGYYYSDQNLKFSNLPPRFDIYSIDEDTFVYVHKEYKLFSVSQDGEFYERLESSYEDADSKTKGYVLDGKNVVIDYSAAVENATDSGGKEKFTLYIDDLEASPSGKVFNKTYWFGSDTSGRDLFVRVLVGARISLLIALVATMVNLFVGVLYGGISGFAGGRIDEIMMRFVDILSTIPLVLYVILMTVGIGSGIKSIILAIGLVYWVRMARIVRGQILSLKERDYVLAARVSGAGPLRIMTRHLLPNAMGPIVVAMTMMIPGAIFTEAFLSFIGLGVSPPMSSWGTLAYDALDVMRSYGYQLFFPSAAICLTVLAFNFLGDGIRDSLDPRMKR